MRRQVEKFRIGSADASARGFHFVVLYDLLQFVYLRWIETFVGCQCNFRLNPKSRFAIRRNNVYMHPRLITGKKIRALAAVSNNRWTHHDDGIRMMLATQLLTLHYQSLQVA
jgi:hypothetical protein